MEGRRLRVESPECGVGEKREPASSLSLGLTLRGRPSLIHPAMPPKTAAELALERKFELLRKKKVRWRKRGAAPMRSCLALSFSRFLSRIHAQAAAAAGAGGGAGVVGGAAGA